MCGQDAAMMLSKTSDARLLIFWIWAIIWPYSILVLIGCSMSTKEGRNKMDDIQWGKPTEDLAISISVTEPIYGPDQAIVLNIAMKNVGKTPVPIVVRSSWIDYSTRAWFEGRTEIPKTPYALRMIKAAAVGRRATRELMTGEVVTESLELNKAYDMTRPGTYVVIVTRETYQKGKLNHFATVTSNELTIKIARAVDNKL